MCVGIEVQSRSQRREVMRQEVAHEEDEREEEQDRRTRFHLRETSNLCRFLKFECR